MYTVYNINSNYMYMYYAHVNVLHVADIHDAYTVRVLLYIGCVLLIIIIIIIL